MMAAITGIVPCLWFDSEAEHAAEHYVAIFPNSKILEITHYGPEGPQPEGSVMTVTWELDGQRFVGLNGGPAFTFSEAVSFQVHCETQDEVDRLWSELTDGGEESQCGWLKDRFGLSWQIIPNRLFELLNDPDQGRSQRAMAAMLSMRKLDIAEMELAADAA
jgi:predicted 3-demethylubiquinone-9 3-methyltransferase (glyoxalase superfamily)